MGLPPTSQAYPSVLLSPTVIKAETEEQREEAITHLVLPAASEERHASFLPPVTEAFTKSVCTTILMAAPSARTWAGPPSSGPVEHRLTANGQSARLKKKILKVKIGHCLRLLRVKSFSTQKGSLMEETEAADG